MAVVSSKISNLTVNIPNGRTESFTAELRVPVNNLLFGILGYMKTEQSNEITLSYNTINNLAGLDYDSEPSITRKLVNEFVGVANPGIAFKQNGDEFDIIGAVDYKNDSNIYNYEYLFSGINMSEDEVTFIMNENKTYEIYTELKNFSKFKMRDYLLIEDKYAKTLYRMLIRFKNTRWRKMRIKDLKVAMGKPNLATGSFISQYIVPSVDLLNELDLNVFDIMFYKKKKGNTITGLEFKFKIKTEIEELERTVSINKALVDEYINDIVEITGLTTSEIEKTLEGHVTVEALLPKKLHSYRTLFKLECRVNDIKRFQKEIMRIESKLHGDDEDLLDDNSDNTQETKADSSKFDKTINMPTSFEEL